MTNPLCDPYLILTKVYQGGKYLKQAIAETSVEPLNKARTVKICYGVLEKDIYLEYILGANVKKQPKSAVKTVLKIALYMLEFMDKHDYMVVDSAVALVKKPFCARIKFPLCPKKPTKEFRLKQARRCGSSKSFGEATRRRRRKFFPRHLRASACAL